MNESFRSFTELDLANIDATGAVPRRRLGDVSSATRIFTTLHDADRDLRETRVEYQKMFDGGPPFSDKELQAAGMGYTCNLNFGTAEAYLEQAMAAYIDLINAVETLVRVSIRYGEPEQRMEWEEIIAEEITRVLRGWPRFITEYLTLCQQFVAHGVGIIHWDDTLDWRWTSHGFGDVLIPRQTKASEEYIEVAVIRRPMMVNHLYSKIENEEAARARGWNVPEVKRAIARACSFSPDDVSEWEKFQSQVKNNDIRFSGAESSKVNLISVLVQEFNGKVSHYASLEDGSNKQFLLEAPDEYENINEAFVFFTYGIGSNGTYHSVRGLGYKIYPHVQWANRLRCRLTDSAMLANATMIQPVDEASLEAFSFNYMGPFAVLSPGVNYVERKSGEIGAATLPVLNDLVAQMSERVGQYSATSMFGGTKEKTRFEVAAQLDATSKLSATSLNLFYEPWTRLLRETVRRMLNPKYTSQLPGGAAVTDLFARCAERGVPPEALRAVDHAKTVCVRAVGAGSKANRSIILQQINEYAGAFDVEGRHRLVRDQVASFIGYEQTDRYIPASATPRMPVDAQIAQLENMQLEMGMKIQIFPNMLHAAHLEVHIPYMRAKLAALEAGEIDLEAATRQLLPLHAHSMEHLAGIEGDPKTEILTARYRQELKSFGEVLNNGVKHIQKLERERAAQAQAQAQMDQQNPQGPNPEELSIDVINKLQKHRAEMQILKEKGEMQLALQMQKAEQERAIEDAKAAAKMGRGDL